MRKLLSPSIETGKPWMLRYYPDHQAVLRALTAKTSLPKRFSLAWLVQNTAVPTVCDYLSSVVHGLPPCLTPQQAEGQGNRHQLGMRSEL